MIIFSPNISPFSATYEIKRLFLKVDGMSKEHNDVIAKYMKGAISKISGKPWTKEGVLNYDLS
jgi:hypothetical protein